MQSIKEYLYYLVLKTYLIDEKNELLLENNYKLIIKSTEEIDWKAERDYTHLLSRIIFDVNISNGTDECDVVYKIKTHRYLKKLLQLSDAQKFNFINNRKIHTLNNYYRVTVKGKINSRNIKIAILKEIVKQLEELKHFDNIGNQKIKKI